MTHKIILEEHEVVSVIRDHVRVKFPDLTKDREVKVTLERVSSDPNPGQYKATVTITEPRPPGNGRD